MPLCSLTGSTLSIPFRMPFKHAAAERRMTQAVWVEARDEHGLIGYGEGCPREYVTSESLCSALSFVQRHSEAWRAELHDLQSIAQWTQQHRGEIDANPAAWCAVELALLDLLGQQLRVPLEKLLGLRALDGQLSYTAVVGDGPTEQFADQVERYRSTGFSTFKIKLSGDLDRDMAKVGILREAGIHSQAVRADANNLWHDADSCLLHLNALGYSFAALEEPLQPGDFAGLVTLAHELDTRIVLDESLLREQQVDALPIAPGRCIINCRVSKMGGLLRSLQVLRAAHARHFDVIVGAQVGETSILTRAALALTTAGGNRIVAREGAYGTHLLLDDVAHPALMFGADGVLDVDALGFADRPGLGLAITSPVQPTARSRDRHLSS